LVSLDELRISVGHIFFSNCSISHVELQIRKFRAKKPKRAEGYWDNLTSFSGFAAKIF
jgi:hypothetical protein